MHRLDLKIAFSRKISTILLFVAAALGACEPPGPEPAGAEPGAATRDAASTAPAAIAAADRPSSCGESGALHGTLFGSINADLNWSADDMACESMRRPGGAGVRLRFTGNVGNQQLAIIIAMPGLTSAETSGELPSVVTTMVEGSGRFFSTSNLNACWSDIHNQEALDEQQFLISATLNCIAPLGELNGDSSVSIPELKFRGIVDWSES